MIPQHSINLSYRILSALERGPMTARQLTDHLHRDLRHVSTVLTSLVEQHLIHICGYQDTGKRGPQPRIYALGKGKNPFPRPPAKTAAEKCKAWRERGGQAAQARTLKRQAARVAKTVSNLFSLLSMKVKR